MRFKIIFIFAAAVFLSSLLISIPLLSQQRLVFKDGSVERVERFEVNDNRVRFKSTERNEWEEVPLSLVDLDATKKLNEKEAGEHQRAKSAPLIQPQETSREGNSPASKPPAILEIAPGVKLPDAYGVYAWDGRNLTQISEAGTHKRSDRRNAIINLVAPAPIMKQKFNIQLDGPTSDTQVHTPTPVFYAHLPEGRGGELSLFKMMVTKSARVLKEVSHSQITGSDSEKSQKYIFTPSIRVGEDLYKVFPTQPLIPGEYCLLIMTPQENQLETTVWDFTIVK